MPRLLQTVKTAGIQLIGGKQETRKQHQQLPCSVAWLVNEREPSGSAESVSTIQYLACIVEAGTSWASLNAFRRIASKEYSYAYVSPLHIRAPLHMKDKTQNTHNEFIRGALHSKLKRRLSSMALCWSLQMQQSTNREETLDITSLVGGGEPTASQRGYLGLMAAFSR